MKILAMDVFSLAIATPLLAPEAPKHEHARLVPIPDYVLPNGEAAAQIAAGMGHYYMIYRNPALECEG